MEYIKLPMAVHCAVMLRIRFVRSDKPSWVRSEPSAVALLRTAVVGGANACAVAIVAQRSVRGAATEQAVGVVSGGFLLRRSSA